MLEINDELIAYLEELSCLILTDDDKERLSGDLDKILGSMTRLGELDTEGVLERSHPFDNTNAFRNDEITPSFDRESILRNAPDRNDEAFVAPKTVE